MTTFKQRIVWFAAAWVLVAVVTAPVWALAAHVIS